MPRRRRLKRTIPPETPRGGPAVAQDKIYDRTTRDIPLNAEIALATVSDPYSDCGENITVTRSIKDDPLAGMLARDQIDKAQFEAGRLWQRYHEQAQVGTVRAIDPTKEAVDGGRIPEPITDRQIVAMRELRVAHKKLGSYDTRLIFMVLGDRMSLNDLADKWRMNTERERIYLGRRFRHALELLAGVWGLVGGKVLLKS